MLTSRERACQMGGSRNPEEFKELWNDSFRLPSLKRLCTWKQVERVSLLSLAAPRDARQIALLVFAGVAGLRQGSLRVLRVNSRSFAVLFC